MPQVEAKLQRGASIADIGCGRGRALIKLAQAFPSSRFVGYDIFPMAVEQASARARAAGVAERVTFQQLDAAKGIPEKLDIISTFAWCTMPLILLAYCAQFDTRWETMAITFAWTSTVLKSLKKTPGHLERCFTA